MKESSEARCPQPEGSVFEVFRAFLMLGLTSFGGPVAHLAYFREEFVSRRRWLSDRDYSDLVALCQFLPGPASSQVGLALGLKRAGWAGSLAAWTGFTLPSAIALILFALGVNQLEGLLESGFIQGLKIAAVAVVAQAVYGMSRSLCTDKPRILVAVLACVVCLLIQDAYGQLGAIAMGLLIGVTTLKVDSLAAQSHQYFGVSKRVGAIFLMLFTALLIALPLWSAFNPTAVGQVIAGFYQSGALVFGGGHVVLPLLQSQTVQPGFVSNDVFLAGYGAAQAVPGPLFTFAAFLGASLEGTFNGWSGGLLMLLVIFIPAALLIFGALPFWEYIRQFTFAQKGMAGLNAAVVGILLAALYDPVWTSAILSTHDFALAVVAFSALAFFRISPVWVIAGCALVGFAL